MPWFVKKQIPVHMMQFDPDNGIFPPGVLEKKDADGNHEYWYIETLEGDMKVSPLSWIAEGAHGERWAIKPEIHADTYDRIWDGLSDQDPRIADWIVQRKERGFDDTETWSLDITLIEWLIPRLKRLSHRKGLPEVTEEIDRLIELMEIHVKEYGHQDPKLYHEMMDLFKDLFGSLWW